MDVFSALVVILICLLLEGFFSGSEIGIVSADRMKLVHDAAKGSGGAKLALQMLKKPEWLLSTTLVGTNISVVTNTTVATALMMYWFGEEYGWLAIVFVTPLIWIFGEIVPKSVFQQRADFITPRAIFILRFASYLFAPILYIFTGITRILSKVVGDQEQNPFTMREEILTMLQMPGQEKGDIRKVEKAMIRRMFNFSETTVRQAMVPLIDVVAVEQEITVGEAIQIAVEQPHVRFPVYDGHVVKLIGVIYVLDLLGLEPSEKITSFIKPLNYVPGNKSVQDLLLEMRQDGEVIAAVVDEFGGAQGIVTIEDIMEEVVEEMQDEYDAKEKSSQWLRKLSERDYVVSGRIEVDYLIEKLRIDIPLGKYATLAGFLLEKAQDVPPSGTVIEANNITFTIQRSTPQAIKEVRIRW